ncbi:MAG TPA: hypothetical protein QGH36_02795, partial [Candidatus Marinimicrobia bacterium]|nr:hypothetical protein [Candidatus Neomarinimicrobiota bacterium]
MIKEFTRIFLALNILAMPLFAQDTTAANSEELESKINNGLTNTVYSNGNGSVNRLPQLLLDVKVLLTEAMIADVYKDTLEVIYYLDRIYDLLGEADQLGEKTDADQEEFDRFIASLDDIYTKRLHTLALSEAPISAAYARQMIDDATIPVEMEMGNSKFVVIDDRDGHIPLVRTKTVDQFIKYFQTKGRKQFQIWLDRLPEYGDLIKDILDEQELPEELVNLAMIESGLNPKAFSKASASG